MKTLYTLAFLFFFIIHSGFSQELPLDFSDSNDSFTAFGGSGFSFNTDPADSSNDVGQFFNDGSDPWQGFLLNLINPIDLDFQETISLSFYGFDPNVHNIVLKLENGTNANVEVTQNVPSGGGWTDNITFDFSNAVLSSDGTTPIDASGTYGALVLFIDGGITTPGTYLIDAIDDGTVATDPNALDVIYSDLVWEDSFNANGPINSNNWFHQTQLPAGGSWFNGEQQHYTNRIENSFVDNGFLNIVAIGETFNDQGQTKQYTSARLNSKFAFTYGRVDVRAKLPFGDGTWPAIWTLGKNTNEDGGYWDSQFGTVNWPASGEIDIMEHGLGALNHTSSALHTPSSFGNTVNVASQQISDVANDFHIYSVNWSPNQITFLVDGVGFYTYNPAVKNDATWPFYEDQYLLLNIAMGGIAGTIDPNFSQSSMTIDYVKVYQNTLSVEPYSANAFRVSPNPASDYINITSEENIDFIALYDVLGNKVLSKTKSNKQIDVTALESGMYFLKIYSEKRIATKKIIIN
ncbi:family 16 glycosylhydrolase [Lacinutrix jangbogonensis]|uniref:family 16 glycosylhydrolase n=1 Tax=Lacinutrix jangbogonensis TaxID=1469557 RepID=UPI00053EF06D|nr:family 16 glycosylhydrolase [Lacinutrix jangbogonensis]